MIADLQVAQVSRALRERVGVTLFWMWLMSEEHFVNRGVSQSISSSLDRPPLDRQDELGRRRFREQFKDRWQ